MECFFRSVKKKKTLDIIKLFKIHKNYIINTMIKFYMPSIQSIINIT